MPEPDRDKTDLGWGLSPGLRLLISPSPPHSRDTQGCHHVHLYGRGTTARRKTSDAPLSSELWHCTAYLDFRPEATWAQPLGPGRAVLTRGVSRRSGSVACVRADASPTEVLAAPACTPTRRSSNVNLLFVWCGWPASEPAGNLCGLLSLVCLQRCRILKSSRCSSGCTPSRKPRCRGCAGCTVSWIGR